MVRLAVPVVGMDIILWNVSGSATLVRITITTGDLMNFVFTDRIRSDLGTPLLKTDVSYYTMLQSHSSEAWPGVG